MYARTAPTLVLAVALLATVWLGASAAAAAPIALDSSSSLWWGLPFSGASDPDDAAHPEAEIVGDATHSAVYYAFDDDGNASNTDGTLYFRMRIGADSGGPGFKIMAVIGIDAGLDGTSAPNGNLDLLVIADFNPPGADQIQVRQVSGAGTSPATTNISSTGTDVAATAANSDWSAVSATDPGDPTDINGDGEPDYFISFSVPFATIVAEMAALGIGNFTDQSLTRLVAGTSTNASSSMNQDIAGVDGGTDAATPWTSSGGTTAPLPIPEPRAGALLGLGLAGLGWRRRRAIRGAQAR